MGIQGRPVSKQSQNSLPLITGSCVDKSEFLRNLGETPHGKLDLSGSKLNEPESEPPYLFT